MSRILRACIFIPVVLFLTGGSVQAGPDNYFGWLDSTTGTVILDGEETPFEIAIGEPTAIKNY